MTRICFVCEWNEGRSVHLALSTRHRLRSRKIDVEILSAGLSQGHGINPLRKDFLVRAGVPPEEIDDHRPSVLGEAHSAVDLILVAELSMKRRILRDRPELAGRVMTVRGFIRGFSPADERLTDREAHIEDAAGHSKEEKLALYEELESLSDQIASILSDHETTNCRE